jgi:hypothetical protein
MFRRFFGKPVAPTRSGGRRFSAARSAVVIASLAAALGLATPCRADLLIFAPALSAQQGSTGTFDVLITNNNAVGGASYDIAGDTVQLSLTGTSGVTFTFASIATVADPYIYVSSGTLPINGGGPLSSDVFPNTTFHATDTEFNPPGFRTINPGDTFGLVHVGYSIAGDAALGLGNLVLGPDTGLADTNGGPITTFTNANGTLTVTPGAPSTPEPSALVLLASGAGLGLIGFARRRR